MYQHVFRLEWGTYLFFAFWAALMTIYAAFFLPETKGVPLEEMQVLWSRHWFWGRFVRNTVRFRTVAQLSLIRLCHSEALSHADFHSSVKHCECLHYHIWLQS